MSELFDEDPRVTPERRSGRSRALVATGGVLIVLFFALSTFASIYTDRMWFRDLGYGSVFSRLLWTRVVLFLVFSTLMALAVGASMFVAYRARPFFQPQGPEQAGLERYREVVTPIRTWLLIGISLLLGMFAGSSGLGQWRNFLLWRNGGSFGVEDAEFGRDLGFFIFDLPWLHYLVDYAMAVLVVALLAAAVVHYLYGGIRLQSPGDRLSGAAQVQLSVLLGLFVLAKAADYYLDRFDLVYESHPLFTGLNYTADNAVLPAKNILMGIAVVCAVLFFLNVWRRTWMLPSVGIALLALSAVLLGLIWPAIVQQFQVRPSEADKEEPYIARNIEATRTAYDLADVEVERFQADAEASEDDAPDFATETSSIPLVDPQVVNQAFEQYQQVRGYYSVANVLDVDRYRIGDRDRALVLGVRELDQSGIAEGDRNWSNLHTAYTHGSGIIAAYANQRPEDGTSEGDVEEDEGGLEWAEGREVGQDDLTEATGGFETRVYFGELSPEYSIVGKENPEDQDVELDIPSSASAEDSERVDYGTYDGAGGIPMDNGFKRFLYALKFGEPNFLLSGRVHDNSEVIYDRDPTQRLEKVAPWLTVDSDPYPAVINGRIQWILDGYTTTDRFPGAQRESFETMTDDALQQSPIGLQTLPTDEVNYMRNAVKATVDAYDGTVRMYAWDEQDPILQAWRSAFPGTVLDKSEIPEELAEHLRYPEDLFKVQRYQLARYHVTDAGDFYQGNNRWEVPEDPYADGQLQPPYRLFVDNPGDTNEDEVFSLTSVFIPFTKDSRERGLASFVSVDGDATDPENYGRLRVLELPDERTLGPGQVANAFASDPDIAEKVAEFNRSGARAVYGNVLTLPVGDGLMNVQPIYAIREVSESSSPILRYVLVKYGDDIGFGATLSDALRDMGADLPEGGVGPQPEPEPEPQPEPGPGEEPEPEPGEGGDESLDELIARANATYAEAEEALQEQDLAAYQEAIEELGVILNQIEAARGGSGAGPTDEPAEESTDGATEGG